MSTYEIITEKIIKLLEAGIVPWRRPWSAVGMPRNLVSQRSYRGINVFLLSATNHASPFWLTLREANQLGGHVRKGKQSQIVVFWKVDRAADHAVIEPDSTQDETEPGRRRFVLRYYRAWNLKQCELPQTVLDRLSKTETHHHDPIEAAERIMAGMPNPPELQYGGSKACYSPAADRITLPCPELFISAAEFYANAFHEMSHATGNPKRLNRKSISETVPFRSPIYAAEELIAEMGAAYLCAEAGISPAVPRESDGLYQRLARKAAER